MSTYNIFYSRCSSLFKSQRMSVVRGISDWVNLFPASSLHVAMYINYNTQLG